MPLAIINQFDGGQAEDVRTFALNEQETSFNFNIYTNPHYLIPYIDMVAETVSSGTITDFALTEADVINVAGTTSLVALGRESSGSNKPQFFRKSSSSDITSSWQAYAVGVNTVIPGTLVVYKGFAYCLGDTGTAHNLQKFNGTLSVSTSGTLGGYGLPPAKPFVHPEDNVLYMGSANIISKWDDSTFTATALTLPEDKVIVSLTNYGTYLAIGCRQKYGAGSAICYLWGRDTTLNTLQGVLDLGVGQLNIIENLNNNLFFVMSKQVVGSYSNVTQNTLTIKGYAGGAVEIIREVDLGSSLGTSLNVLKQKRNETLFFAFSSDTAIYRFGKNKSGSYYLSHDRAYPSGTTTVTGFSIIGDFMWLGHSVTGTSNRFYRTIAASESQAFATTSTYVTTINPSMVVEDRYRDKTLIAVAIAYTAGQNNGTVGLKLSTDGSTYTTLVSTTTSAGEGLTEATAQNSNGQPIGEGREFQFKIESTGNSKIKEIRYIYKLTNSQLS